VVKLDCLSSTTASEFGRIISMLNSLKRMVVGTPLEGLARRVLALASSPTARKNRRDDEALRVLIRSLADDASCVDVGANIGHILAAMVESCPNGRHVAFEPVPQLALDLRRRFPSVEVRAQAVAEAPGRTSFTLVPAKPSRSGISATLDLTVDASTQEIEIEVTTLDEALPVSFRPTLIKVDVEGGELEALLGARRVLSDHHPILALEHQYGRRRDPERTLRIYDLLDDLGYELRTIGGESLTRQRFADVVGERLEWNFLAYPC
jgi:FkbM family methyltransferase